MIGEPRVKPECYADTLLIEMILKKSVNHVPGNGNLAKLFIENKYEHLNFICITDNDKEQPKVFKELPVKRIGPYPGNDLILKQKPNTDLYLIIINPGLEKWLLQCCDAIEFDRGKYPSLLKSLSTLKKALKDENVSENSEVKNFFNSLINRNSPPPQITKLRKWIGKLLVNN